MISPTLHSHRHESGHKVRRRRLTCAAIVTGVKKGRPEASRLALSVLRARVDAASAESHWSVDLDGLSGRGLVTTAGSVFSVPLRLESAVRFEAHVRLLPHDWRDGGGRLRPTVTAVYAARRTVVWSGELRSAAHLGGPEGLQVACELGPSTTMLELSVDKLDPREARAVARAVWLEPALVDPSAPPPSASAGRPVSSSGRSWPGGPLISIITPVHDPPPEILAEAIESVRHQTIGDWELYLVDDGSSDPEVIAMLERYAAIEPRIRLTRRRRAGGISSATNAALAMAAGEYIVLLDHDDTLEPDTLERIAAKVAEDPSVDMIYSDEDVIAEDGIVTRHLKPAWSPEHLALVMYTCHVGVYRRALAVELGGFRSEFDGCQDYDFVLRLSERTDRVAHIPETLYHWRAHLSSTAGGDQAKPYAYMAQPRAIAAHLKRTGVDAEVQFGPLPGQHRVVHRVDPEVRVSLAVAVADERGLAEAAQSWNDQPHKGWDVAIAAPQTALERCLDALAAAGVELARVSTVAADPAAERAAWLATAARAASGDYVLLMQDPVAGLTHDWLANVIGYSAQEGIGAGGPVVVSPEGRIIEAGIAIPEGIPIPLHYGFAGSERSPATMNVSAVSGVLATSARVYRSLGGLDATFRDLALIDYCLRALQAGLRIVTVGDVRMQATGPDRTTNDLSALWRLREAWSKTYAADPFYNPHYRCDRGDFVPRDGLG
jgi:O-antigen biosynthesis protein